MISWACELAYGHSVNVHHKTYEHLGAEEFGDLQVLCRRCHQIEHFGKSDLPKIVMKACRYCTRPRLCFEPALTAADILAMGRPRGLTHASEIVSWMARPSEQTIKSGKRLRKLLEVMQHPNCQVRAYA